MNTTTSDDPIISQPRRPVDAHEPTLTAVRDSKLEDTADFLLGHPLEFINQHFDPSTPHDDLAEEFQIILVDKQQPEAERGDEDGESSDELGEDIDEFSILPVLHTVIVSPMSYERLNREVTTSEFDFEGAAKIAKSFFETRLNGDKLAAEFLLLHLLSKIRHRKDGHLSGFLPLNISGFSPLSANGVSAGDSVFDALAQVIPRCCRVPVNLSDLASVRFAPGQFLEKTPKEKIVGLSAGELQVPDGTWLVVDELGLEPGKLNEQATLNVRHLSGLVADAKIPYAHGFGAGQQVAEFPMDVGVVILSATKSILPVDCVVPIDPNAVLGNEETTAADLDKIRELIHRCRSVSEYAIPSEIEKVSTSFFTHKRKTDSTYSPEQFSLRLELARSLSLLVGSSKMTMQAWRRSGELEEERARRLAEAKKGGSSSSGER
ncbi:hypothetical protein DFJ73DRAFT_820574 [Zopfochytrium polystomum]|nr:hypothetical protein DFJ73DRAFT_820574 [Zopfochytrium polystomum]